MFSDRVQAAQKLAKTPELAQLSGSADSIVLGIPRGGVITAAALAKALKLPLDVIVTRKITTPENPEYAIGAVGESSPAIWNKEAADLFSDRDKKSMEDRARIEAVRRNRTYQQKGRLDLTEKAVILVDDGLATGLTMLSAVQEAKQQGAKKVIVATPVAPPDTVEKLRQAADAVVVLTIPVCFAAVGQFYQNFPQVGDEEVLRLLPGKRRSVEPAGH